MRKLVVVLAAGAVLLSACTTAEQDEQPATEAIAITMTEFAFDPDPLLFPAGREITLTLVNDGDVPHEFMAGREPMPDNGGYLQDLFDGVHPTVTPPDAAEADPHDAHAGFMVLVQPGEDVEVVFTLPGNRAGEWEIGCFEPSHYEAGMHTTLTVSR
jgi:uncharacterized cupredoxin-like copper-binding protein